MSRRPSQFVHPTTMATAAAMITGRPGISTGVRIVAMTAAAMPTTIGWRARRRGHSRARKAAAAAASSP
jgi:hypothetical protein